MGMLTQVIEMLASLPVAAYLPGDPAAAEPAALAALALIEAGEFDAGYRHASWLGRTQAHAGSVGVFADQGAPAWSTGLAVLAWIHWGRRSGCAEFQPHVDRAVEWILSSRGVTQPSTPELGHDPTLNGWSWAEGTHAWVEPSGFQILALKGAGFGDHARVREGVRLLLDRQLPEGGCNYGNTFVLGQKLLPHIQPTAIAMLALWGEPEDSRRALGLAYLRREWRTIRGVASRCFAAMALKAYPETRDVVASDMESLLAIPAAPVAGHTLALLALSLLDGNPILPTPASPSNKDNSVDS